VKIAIIRKKYTYHGGAEGFSSRFIELLAAAGHEIHIFAIRWQAEKVNGNIHFHRVPAITAVSFLRDLTFAVSCYIVLKSYRRSFDIIQTHDKTLYQDIYRAGDGCHIEWLKQRWKRTGLAGKISIISNPYHWLILRLERAILRGGRFRVIIAISDMVKRNIMQHYGVAPNRIEVLYNGVDLDRFNPENRRKYRREIRERYGLAEEDFVILFVGSGFERKGVKYLLQAVESVPESVAVMIVGKGKGSSVLAHDRGTNPPSGSGESDGRAFQRRQKIIFCGPQEDIEKYYSAADIFVFPTIYEPFGNVHLEALASGLPVITTKNSGASEIIVDGEQGFVIDRPEDVASLSEKVRYCLHHRDFSASMGDNARKLAEEFSNEKHIARVLELYQRILSGQYGGNFL
jgi:UDP-glucose:(heptosyl)LPS alpha-1,3-glucosyltransferase